MKNFTIDAVERLLTKKGVVITHEAGISQKVTRYKDISEQKVKDKVAQLGLKPEVYFQLMAEGTLLTALGIAPEKIIVSQEIQAPMTVNVGNASNLGNGSWGKIDFLIKHKGYRLAFSQNRETKIMPEVRITS